MAISSYIKKPMSCKLELKIGIAVLPMVNKIKIFSIYICHDLIWRYKISCIREKVNSVAILLHIFGSTFNRDTRAKIFDTLLRRIYCMHCLSDVMLALVLMFP